MPHESALELTASCWVGACPVAVSYLSGWVLALGNDEGSRRCNAPVSLAMLIIVIGSVRVIGLRSFSKMSSFDFAVTVSIGSILGGVASSSANVTRLEQVRAVVLETTGDLSVLHGPDDIDPAILDGLRRGAAVERLSSINREGTGQS